MGINTVLLILFTLCFSSLTGALKDKCQIEDKQTIICNYIPEDIPHGITVVHIIDFKDIFKDFVINTSNFQSKNWANVKYLELNITESEWISTISFLSGCFRGLKLLRELHIHVMTKIRIDPETFIGLNCVKHLDMSGCVRLTLNELVRGLRGKTILPALEYLKLSRLHGYRDLITIDSSFAEALKDKKVTHLDFTDTKIADVNVTAIVKNMQNLQVINISYSFITHFTIDESMDTRRLDHINLDASSVQTPLNNLPGSVKVYNQGWQASQLSGKAKFFLSPHTVNMTSWLLKSTAIWLKNCTIEVNVPLQWKSQIVIGRDNNIKSLDVKMLCKKYTAFTIKHVDAAQNGLEFLHPSIFSCFPNIETMDLSTNQLSKMYQEDHILFGTLFTLLQYLKTIYLSNNKLKYIPKDFFEHNLELAHIDLSHNLLDQITFIIHHLKKLEVLDLQYNNIKILDELSLNRLDSTNYTDVLLKSNPIACSDCDAKPFIQWLTRNTLEPGLYCNNEKGEQQNITQDTVELVQSICKRKIMLISGSVASGFILIAFVVAITVMYKRRKLAKRETNMNNCLRNLREGQGQYEFVAFLSYSSEDTDFIEEYVEEQLNENLQLLTGIDRKLICTGDENLRPGFLILDETVKCIEKATVVISVVSNSYCNSRYCHNELDQAYRLNKPIILMLKEHVDENRMMPTMKMLFKNNVRILWTFENNEYALKTTWENVCESILDLIASKM